MQPYSSQLWLRYGIAIASVSLIIILRSSIIFWTHGHYPLLMFLLPVLIGTWYGGAGPGILAAAYGLAAGTELDPSNAIRLDSAFGQERTTLFFLVAGTGIFIITRLQNAHRRLEAQELRLKAEILEKTRIEADLREQAEVRACMEAALEEALQKAEQANNAKSEFLATMSHEIRTPMNAVIGIASLLARPGINPSKHRQLIETLQLSAQSLMLLINDLLDMAKIEQGQIEIEEQSFDLVKLLEEVMSILSVRAEEKSIALTLCCEDSLKGEFLGDSARIRQILMNLVSNAIKFTEAGGVTLAASYGESGAGGRKMLCVEVRDTGIGIPADKIEVIFNKFSQADGSITRKYGGTGLGLAISKRLSELMGGGISVVSEPGAGSAFTVRLPLARLRESHPENSALAG